jgi:dTMP kinase
MLAELVAPALALGRDVVCERFHPSTVAYQGAALGVGEGRVLALLSEWAGEPAPDLTLILDLDPGDARARRGSRDRFEAERHDFHRRVAEAYRRFAARAERTVLVEARGDVDEVAARVWREVQRAGR